MNLSFNLRDVTVRKRDVYLRAVNKERLIRVLDTSSVLTYMYLFSLDLCLRAVNKERLIRVLDTSLHTRICSPWTFVLERWISRGWLVPDTSLGRVQCFFIEKILDLNKSKKTLTTHNYIIFLSFFSKEKKYHYFVWMNSIFFLFFQKNFRPKQTKKGKKKVVFLHYTHVPVLPGPLSSNGE